MIHRKPHDISQEQWLLLQHLATYTTPFYISDIYLSFKFYEPDRLLMYKLFYRLAVLNYIELVDFDALDIPDTALAKYYLTRKGLQCVALYARNGYKQDFTLPLFDDLNLN